MRRAGQNPTDVEVHDMINKIDNGSGVFDFEDFLIVMREKNKETDMEIHFKDTFRAFSKDDDGRIHNIGLRCAKLRKSSTLLCLWV